MHFIKQLRDFLHLVNNDKGVPVRQYFFTETGGAKHKLSFHFGVEEVIKSRRWKLLMQECSFPDFPRAPQKCGLVIAKLEIKGALVNR